MISLYTHKDLLIPENRRAVHPLLFDLHYFENVHPSVSQHYHLVKQPEDADAFIFPVDYLVVDKKGYHKEYKELYHLAIKHKKKLHVYTGGDYGTTFKDDSIITWRNAGFKSTNDVGTIIIPAFINDPLERKDLELKIHSINRDPHISFTGFANSSFKERLRVYISTIKSNLLRRLGKCVSDIQAVYNAAGERFTYLKKFESHPAVQTDFIYRNKYRAGAVTKEQREQSTIDFFQNLNNSPYTFCLRGAGNFSVRFYEALACGRIPVLIDTDVQLPLETEINWERHICRVLPHEDASQKLLEFHRSMDAKSFEDLQQSNRELYENKLVRHSYFCSLHDVLLETI